MKLSDDSNNMEVEVNTKCKSKHGSVKYTKQDSDSKTEYIILTERRSEYQVQIQTRLSQIY